MTIRWKLNLSVIALIAVFLLAAGISLRAVRQNAEQTLSYARMRELSQLTADIRTQVYQYLSGLGGVGGPELFNNDNWPRLAVEVIDIQVRLAEDEHERELWEKVRGTVQALGEAAGRPVEAGTLKLVRQAEHDLWELRTYYDLAQSRSIAATASTSFMAQAAVTLACLLTVLLFLIHLMIVRRWLLRPIQVLKASAETIGQGRLDHQVPLRGGDELAQLARCIDAMAKGLAAHQAALLQARELSALGELCANVAHGLRNPLAALRASAQLAELRAEGTSDAQSLIRDLARQADRMDQRISRLFQFSRPLELRPRPATFGELAQAAQAQVFPLLQSSGVSLHIDDRTAGTVCHLDDEQLAQALAELIANAAHHSSPGSTVTLRGSLLGEGVLSTERSVLTCGPPAVESKPGNGNSELRTGNSGLNAAAPLSKNGQKARLCVQIIDRGTGMTPATRNKVFDLFFTTRPDGSGIGLAMVRRFVERHQGQINIDSSPGAGTTFTINLPLA